VFSVQLGWCLVGATDVRVISGDEQSLACKLSNVGSIHGYGVLATDGVDSDCTTRRSAHASNIYPVVLVGTANPLLDNSFYGIEKAFGGELYGIADYSDSMPAFNLCYC
jgi:hypothetical protein